uniref:phosphomannomutase/phosphoglucomutase n=1 Tax=Polaromonas sp. TaxID=1869339 RepID=UPI0017DD4305
QITGSHNPKDYNGFKMLLAGRAIYGDEIQGLRKMMEAPTLVASRTTLPPEGANFPRGGPSENSSSPTPPPRTGKITNINVLAPYRDRIVSDIKLARPMKVVIDSGNGIAGASAPGIFRALGCEVTELFSEVDGDFPNHHPDPSKPENLKDLIAALQVGDAELGLAFDGDGDRLGIVTRDGQNIYPDRQMMLFARDVLSRVPGGTIVYDVKCSQRLAPEIEAAGGTPLMYKTGHSLIKAKMKELDSPLGGEMSGHIFFKERWFGFDDGTYAGARLLEILSKVADVGALLNGLPTSFSTPELNVACKEGEPHAVVEQLIKTASEPVAGPPQGGLSPLGGQRGHGSAERGGYFPAPAKINTIDGVRVDWPDGFGLIRASNTTPVLVLRFEGHTEAALKRIETDMLQLLRSVKPDASFAAAVH